MAAKIASKCLPVIKKATPKTPVIGVFAPCDPRIDAASRTRAQNIIAMVADTISGQVVLPDKQAVGVVYSSVLVDSEAQADVVAQQFRQAGCEHTRLCAGYVGVSAIDQYFVVTAIPEGYAAEYYLRQQWSQAGCCICSCVGGSNQSVRQNGAFERR